LAALEGDDSVAKKRRRFAIHPQLAEELRTWRQADAEPADRVVSTVPNMKCLRADLALAGIADIDEAGRYVDFHSLRVLSARFWPPTGSVREPPKP